MLLPQIVEGTVSPLLPSKQQAAITCHGDPVAPSNPCSQTSVTKQAAPSHPPGHYRLHSACRLHHGHLCYFELFLRLLGGNVSRVCVRESVTVEVIFSRQCLEVTVPKPSKADDVLAAVEKGGK